MTKQFFKSPFFWLGLIFITSNVYVSCSKLGPMKSKKDSDVPKTSSQIRPSDVLINQNLTSQTGQRSSGLEGSSNASQLTQAISVNPESKRQKPAQRVNDGSLSTGSQSNQSTFASNIPQSGPIVNQTNTGCDFPTFDPFNKILKRFSKKFPTIDCSNQTPHLVYAQGDTITVNHTKIRSIPYLRSTFKYCQYQARVRDVFDKEMQTVFTGPIFTNSINVTHSYVVVECYNNTDDVISRSYLTFIRKKPNLESELKAKYEAHVELHAPKETLSVMMVGIDAISKNNFQRAMPKTRNFLLETMKAVELYKHNKFGHNTFPNVVGLLTGMNEESLANLGYSDLRPLDIVNDAFLWSAYRKAGYRTGMFLDRVEVTGFHYSKYGWEKPPVDYYLREVILDSETDSLMRNNSNCIGDIPEIRLLTDYWVQLATLFNNSKTEPYFLYSLSTRSTHDYENKASAIDEHYFQFLQTLVDKKVLNNTVLVFFSDHGPKRGSVRTTYYGMLENRMPLMFLVFPPWFHTKYPQLMEVVKTNQHRLTTHTDVYETLIDLLYFKAEAGKGSLTQPRISLFKEIPEGRTCQHALIPIDYCACNITSVFKLSRNFVHFLGQRVIAKINRSISTMTRNPYADLYLDKVIELREIRPDAQGRTRYNIIISADPSGAIYQAVITLIEENAMVRIGLLARLDHLEV
ncbi:uncharacterized protein LOC131934929 [Physella acuta]|uniref:uncharacterized protein LOC131934929 n=1 Tax=Physella acuta TaxID=109671 RepID=UPI0027DB35D7|nr:uncharacterized protein LOC131934929 [Physella acuta]